MRSVIRHNDYFHVTCDDLKQFVGVGVHLPTGSALRAIEASSDERMTVEVCHHDVLTEGQTIECRVEMCGLHRRAMLRARRACSVTRTGLTSVTPRAVPPYCLEEERRPEIGKVFYDRSLNARPIYPLEDSGFFRGGLAPSPSPLWAGDARRGTRRAECRRNLRERAHVAAGAPLLAVLDEGRTRTGRGLLTVRCHWSTP